MRLTLASIKPVEDELEFIKKLSIRHNLIVDNIVEVYYMRTEKKYKVNVSTNEITEVEEFGV